MRENLTPTIQTNIATWCPRARRCQISQSSTHSSLSLRREVFRSKPCPRTNDMWYHDLKIRNIKKNKTKCYLIRSLETASSLFMYNVSFTVVVHINRILGDILDSKTSSLTVWRRLLACWKHICVVHCVSPLIKRCPTVLKAMFWTECGLCSWPAGW